MRASLSILRVRRAWTVTTAPVSAFETINRPALPEGLVRVVAAGVDPLAALAELRGLGGEAGRDVVGRGRGLLHLADLLGDLHRAELGAAHGAEVGTLGGRGRERLVVEVLGGVGIERQVELVLPAELEARLAEGVVAQLSA